LVAPLHRHHREDEFTFVLAGAIGTLRGDEVVIADQGTWVFKPGRPGSFLPGLPQIRTCATHASGSSRSGFANRCAIRCGSVYEFVGFDDPYPFPRSGSAPRQPLPSPGSGRLPFPCFSGTMSHSDALPPILPHFVSFAWQYHPARLYSSLPQARRRLGTWSFRDWQPPGQQKSGDDRASQVPGELSCAYALFSDPGRTAAAGRYAALAWPPNAAQRRLLARGNFGAEWHGLGTGCLRFARWIARRGRKTRFWLLAKLYQTGFAPAEFHRKVSAMLNTSRPPLPSFSWRRLRPFYSTRSYFLSGKGGVSPVIPGVTP
jgi:hypothetical protein